MRLRSAGSLLLTLTALANAPSLARAGAHTWDVVELFSNSCGNIQFIELREMNGGAGEIGVGGWFISSNAHEFDIPSNVAAPTSNKRILFATADFAALPGAPAPNFIIPSNFFDVNGDTVTYGAFDDWTFGPGELPTDGIKSLNRDILNPVRNNTPTNYVGVIGSVNVAFTPPAVPDGNGASTPVEARPYDSLGPAIEVSWDTDTCCGPPSHHIVYGGASQLPTAPQTAFEVDGAVCGLGGTSPYVWLSPPEPSDGGRLLWFLVLAGDGNVREGSWGQDSTGAERMGPGTNGSSGLCGVADKYIANACGN